MSPHPEQPELINSALATFRYHKQLADRAVAQVSDEQLRAPLDAATNGISVILQHLAGNAISRWTDFLTTDGEKPGRNRDQEFVDRFRTRDELLAYWEQGCECWVDAVGSLDADDLNRTVTIRGEQLSVPQAILRSVAHFSYHVGQIVMIARIHASDSWTVLTVPRGGSDEYNRKHWQS